MEENRQNSLAGGTEVLVGGGGNVFKWIEISVPSPTPPPSIGTNSSEDDECVWLPSNEDYASSSVLGEPPIYFIWRINKTRPNALEILQLSAKSGFPITRLRFVFDHTLSPFAVVYTYEGSDPLVFFVYALTSSGAIYVLRVSNTSAYKSGSAFPLDHLIHLDAGPHLNENRVTSVAASPGYLFLGRSDGCVSCFQPVVYFQRSSGFHQELRLDTGFGRLWGFVRGTVVAPPVRDLFVSDVHGRDYIFVLHADGALHVWDTLTYSRVLCQSTSIVARNVEGNIS